MTARTLLSVLALLLSAACQDRARGAATAEEAVQLTNHYFAEDSPQVNLSRFTIETADLGERWRVTYDVPGGSTGTPVIFEVDKRSGTIIYEHGGQ